MYNGQSTPSTCRFFLRKPPSQPAFTEDRESCRCLVRHRLARGPRQSESSASAVRIAAAHRRRRGSGARAEESLGGNISRHLHRKMPTFLDKITPRGASLLPNSHHVATGREGSSDSYPRCSAQCGGLRSSGGRRAGPARASRRLVAACGAAAASPPQLRPILARGADAEISPPPSRPPQRRSPTTPSLLARRGSVPPWG